MKNLKCIIHELWTSRMSIEIKAVSFLASVLPGKQKLVLDLAMESYFICFSRIKLNKK